MTAAQAIRNGLSMVRRAKGVVFIFFFSNLLLAAATAAPMYSAISDHVGHSMAGQELARGFSAAWLTEFQIAYADFLKGFSIAIVYAGILFLALNTLLSAGALEVLARGEGAGMHAFGRGMGKFFFRCARIVIIASLFYFVLFWFWETPVATGLDRIFRNSIRERWHFYLNWVRWGLLFFTVFVVNAISEYAKADVVIDEHGSALAALGHAAGFVFGRFRRVMSIYLGMGCLTLATIFVYALFARYFPQSNALTIFVWFVVAQILIWYRWKYRLASWAAELAYYRAHRPTPMPVGERPAAARRSVSALAEPEL